MAQNKSIKLSWPENSNHGIQVLPKSDFIFVNTAGAEKLNGYDRTTVRAHARRQAWRSHKHIQYRDSVNKRRRKKPDNPKSMDGTTSLCPCDSGQSCSHESPSIPNTPYSTRSDAKTWPEPDNTQLIKHSSSMSCVSEEFLIPQIMRRSTGSAIDPFEVFPVTLTPRVRCLLQYGAENVVRTSVHEDDDCTFARYAGGNRGLLYTSLAWASAKMNNVGMGGNDESIIYMSNAISAVREDLETRSGSLLTDGTIAAVACISNLENLSGDTSNANIHTDGLRQMVNARGGAHCLPEVLRRLILWSDLLSATKQQSLPILPLQDFSHLGPLSTFVPSGLQCPAQALDKNIFGMAVQLGITSFPLLLQDAHELAYFLDITPPNNIRFLNIASYPDRVYTLEYRILHTLSFLRDHPISQSLRNHTAVRMVPLLLHGLLLFIYTNLRLTPVGDQTRKVLTMRLHSHLASSDIPILSRSFAGELMWIFFLGAVSAEQGSQSRSYFTAYLQQSLITENSCHQQRGALASKLREVMWLEKGFMKSCQDLWKHIWDDSTISFFE